MKLFKQQAERIENRENARIPSIGQGKARNGKNKRD
jgi:hypothetical protein